MSRTQVRGSPADPLRTPCGPPADPLQTPYGPPTGGDQDARQAGGVPPAQHEPHADAGTPCGPPTDPPRRPPSGDPLRTPHSHCKPVQTPMDSFQVKGWPPRLR
eukprot:3029967-Pyramimonas_sp.AAC.1